MAALTRDLHLPVRQLFHQLSPYDLPLAVYLAARDGRLLECNRRAREILALPVQDPIDCAIADFYSDPSERGRLLGRLEKAEAEGRYSVTQPIRLCVGGRDVFVQESVRALRDAGSPEVVGYVGCLVDVTEQERPCRLLNQLRVGVYRLDAEDCLVYANDVLATILGYGSREEIVGRSASEFYAVPETADSLRDLVMKGGSLGRQVTELMKKGGDYFFASISSTAIVGPDGQYEGQEGILVDATWEERLRSALDNVPLGFYEVRSEDGRDIIRACNLWFAQMFGFESEDEVIGLSIVDLYADPNDAYQFIEVVSADSQSLLLPRHLLGVPLKVRDRQGREFAVEVVSRLLMDRDGNIIGRTGVVRDVSREYRWRDEVRQLQSNIGAVLHSYSSAMAVVHHAVTVAIESMGPAVWERGREREPDEVDAALVGPVARLAASLNELVESVESDWTDRSLSPEHWVELSRLATLLPSQADAIPLVEFRPPALRRIARRVTELCGSAQRGTLPDEQRAKVVRDAVELERVTCVNALHRAEDEIVALDSQLRALRDYLTTGARPEEAPQVVRVWDLVRQAMMGLEEFAHRRGVEFRESDESRNACVKVVKRDVSRALGSLLHNAVKYSWSRAGGEGVWVMIRARVEEDRVLVDIENYGVPIPRDEIEEGQIFRLGYRGRLSSDRGRLGTGIGLYDALSVSLRHGGRVTLTSRPAIVGARVDDYTKPYVTVATLELPLHSTRERD